MALFVLLPFVGAWIGYTYAPVKVLEVVRNVETETVATGVAEKDSEQTQEVVSSIPNFGQSMVSAKAAKPENFTCDHSHLNMISEDLYTDWPTYSNSEFGISFSYPPNQPPNEVKRNVGNDGKVYLQVGYNPNVSSGTGKAYLYDIDNTWEVNVQKTDDSETLVDSSYCLEHNWCLLEKLDFQADFDSYVSSYEEIGMGDIEMREYHLYSKDGLLVELTLPAATQYDGSACDVISETFNLDKIAHSIRLQK